MEGRDARDEVEGSQVGFAIHDVGLEVVNTIGLSRCSGSMEYSWVSINGYDFRNRLSDAHCEMTGTAADIKRAFCSWWDVPKQERTVVGVVVPHQPLGLLRDLHAMEW